MAGAIERRHDIGHEQRDQQDQKQGFDEAQIEGFAMREVGIAGTDKQVTTVPAIFKPF